MKLGYPCINRSISCTANNTFRLASYSEERMIETIKKNLACLQKTLEWNLSHGLLFFRIGSGLIPFASHPICIFDWKAYFKNDLESIGNFIKMHDMRISMHPDQFVLINAKEASIVENSIAELVYHAELLDALGLGIDAKIQLHVGGVYGDKRTAKNRFIQEYHALPDIVQWRLVIEHDHNRFSFRDCFEIHEKTEIPIVIDTLHHACLNNGESLPDIMKQAANTWQTKDGILIVDYSNQKIGGIKGAHAESIDKIDFLQFLQQSKEIEFDCMLEIKDKEKSALVALDYLCSMKKIA